MLENIKMLEYNNWILTLEKLIPIIPLSLQEGRYAIFKTYPNITLPRTFSRSTPVFRDEQYSPNEISDLDIQMENFFYFWKYSD